MLTVAFLVPVNATFDTVVSSLILGLQFSPGFLLLLHIFSSSSFFTHVLNTDVIISVILDSENGSFPYSAFSWVILPACVHISSHRFMDFFFPLRK